ncbi:immunoglobulin superfamily member 3-like [Megalops cyprinoides]|uniref:immunoglobulin superfamily member 3-like n=1 Tax=Megalops cyprinoides TaxID=118141 RepID=UPI001863F4E7|nr:immunoglobulin superfamily member 3-like [Megalops cyprinoides]
MDLLQCDLSQTALLLWLKGLLWWDVCVGQRVVQMQEGPLYRVRGYPVSISCNVSGFGGAPVQNFGFSIYKPTRPDIEIKIISTYDQNFAYAVYSKRVREKKIEIKRLTGSSVQLHIKTLEDDDTGEYECQTPNTDGRYLGSYFAKTQLNVVQDTLSVSSNSAVLTKTEGDPLKMECEVSSQTFQHTHLSVTWFLRRDKSSEPQRIISLNRDFTLRPGEGFKDRHRSGLMGLDKLEETTYRLSISQLQTSDQGSIYCEASEWIQDPDRSWYRIAYKSTEVFTLQVRSRDVPVDRDLFNTLIEVPKSTLQEGNALEIKCIVEAQNVLDSYFSVAWLKDDKEVARFGPTGVPSVRMSQTQRESKGELKVIKKSNRDYLLIIQPVHVEDAGSYQCRVWKEEKTAGFTPGQSYESNVEHVTIAVTNSKLAVSTPNKALTVTEGDMLRVICRVSGTSRLLSITWQHRFGQGSYSNVVSLNQGGVMEVGMRYRQRAEVGDVRVLHIMPDSFMLEIANTMLSDSGVYKCTVSEWVEATGNVEKTDSKSEEMTADVRSLDSVLCVDLKSRTVRVTENEKIELFCTVKGPKVPLSVTWKFKHPTWPSQEEIVSLFHTGIITWWKERWNYQLWTQVQPGEASYVLQVFRASRLEGGMYQCVVEAFLRENQRLLKISNELAVNVQRPDSRLSISMGPKSPVKCYIGADIRIQCNVLIATSNSSHFAVSWLFQRKGEGNHTILSADRDSIVVSGAGKRYSLRRQGAQSYELLLQRMETGDSGQYYCQVEEWLQDTHGEWYSLSPKSAMLELAVVAKQSIFSVVKDGSEVRVPEGGQVNINCTLGPGSGMPSSQYSVTWFFSPAGSSDRVALVQFDHNGVLEQRGLTTELMKRAHFHRHTPHTFGLTIQNVDVDDSGCYSCQVDEYQLNCEGSWLQTATDQSGATNITVFQTGTMTLYEDTYSLGTLPVLLVILILVLTMAVGALLYKLWRASNQSGLGKKKPADSLWAKGTPLKPQPEA